MRKQTIYAPRLKGDLDLGLEPSRIWPDGTKAWSRMDTPGGLLPGGSEQDIYAISGTANYRIGTRRVQDERVFRYAQIYGVNTIGGRAVANLEFPEEVAVAAATSAVAATTVTITVQAAAGLAANELAGGYVCYKSTRYYQHRILSHPAADNAATCVLTLETALVGHGVETGVTTLIVYRSPWRRVGHGAAYGAGVSFVGWPFGDIVIGQYTWVQTWGPVNVVTGAFVGGLPSLRQAWFLNDGSIGTFVDPSTNETAAYQHAGFWIPCTFYGGALHDMSDGGHLLFLQICP